MSNLELSNREQVADWIETTLLVRGRPLSRDVLNSCGFADAGISDDQIAAGLTAMRIRQKWLSVAYPFAVEDVAVRVSANARSSHYSTLLLLTPGSPMRQLISPQPTSDMAAMFERLTVCAVESLLGPGARALRFGWPSDIGRPQQFHSAIEWLASKMGLEAGAAYRPPKRKDGGVDVVGWRPFPDGKSGFPIVLVQCTLQKELVSKSKDIDVRNWSGWLKFEGDPTTVLAVPGLVSSKEDWNEITLRSWLLDRVRLVGLLCLAGQERSFNVDEFVGGSLLALSDWLSGSGGRSV